MKDKEIYSGSQVKEVVSAGGKQVVGTTALIMTTKRAVVGPRD